MPKASWCRSGLKDGRHICGVELGFAHRKSSRWLACPLLVDPDTGWRLANWSVDWRLAAG